MSYNILPEVFFNHHQKMMDQWNNLDNNQFDAIVISNGKQDTEKIFTTSVNVWFWGYDIIDTVLAFTKKSIIYIASNKKIQMIESFKTKDEFTAKNMQLLVKDAKDNKNNLEKLMDIIKNDAENQDNIKIGHINKDQQAGAFHEEYMTMLNDNKQFEISDCTHFISQLFTIKDTQEIQQIQKASKLTKYVFTRLVSIVEDIIDQEKPAKHSEIAEKAMAVIEDEKEQQKMTKKYGVDFNGVDFAYNPVVQSGGKYDLSAKSSNTDKLKHDILIESLGVNYNQYNANVSRTYFIDPIDDQKKNYEAIYNINQNLIKEWLRPGKKMNEIYDLCVNNIKEKIQNFDENKMPKSFGNGIGLLFKEEDLNISENCDREIQVGMVFNTKIAIADFKTPSMSYAINLQDTVIVQEENNQSFTNEISSKLEDISYFLNDQSDEDNESQDNNKNGGNRGNDNNTNPDMPYRTRARQNVSKQIVDTETLNNRKQHQTELREQKLQEMKERLINGGFSKSKRSNQLIDLQKLQTYKSESEIPQELNTKQIYIDNKRNAVLLPINGKHVPININIIKNCSKQEEGQKIFSVRLNFHNPGINLAQNNLKFVEINPDTVYVKELTFKSKDEEKLTDIIKKIKELQKKVKQQQLDKSNLDEIADHEHIQYIKGKRPVLKDLNTRPNVSTKRAKGMLECHKNGFRFVTQKQEICEFTFNNIKHAFFQPCDKEIVIVLHFHFKKPILINKKKTYDLQVYTEAGMTAIDLNQRRRGGYDDDYDDEEQEKIHRKKLNRDFKAFIKACEDISKENEYDLTFDKPFRDLGFDGAPQRATVFLQPTVNCLINVVETPPFVLTIEDIEIACFERMVGSLKNFDLVFVFKDYDRPVQKINVIPIAKVEDIKNWLNSMEIIFFDSAKPIQWTTILNEIKKDIEGFVEDGGWEPVLEESEEEEVVDSADQDSDFGSSSINSSEDFSDDDDSDGSFSGSLVSEDDSEGSADSELSEEGLSWSDMHKKAQREDEQKMRERMEEERSGHKSGGNKNRNQQSKQRRR